MKKLFFAAFFVGIILVLPGCHEKKWWEGVYESEEAAMLDQLNCEIANLRQELEDARTYRY